MAAVSVQKSREHPFTFSPAGMRAASFRLRFSRMCKIEGQTMPELACGLSGG
jgi:hypothetical protein